MAALIVPTFLPVAAAASWTLNDSFGIETSNGRTTAESAGGAGDTTCDALMRLLIWGKLFSG